MPLQPRRMTGAALRLAAKTVRVPLIGKGVRKAALAMYGLGDLRAAHLGSVTPYDPAQPPSPDPGSTQKATQ